MSSQQASSMDAGSRPQGKVRFGVVGCGRIGATADDRASRWAVAPWWLPLSHASAIAATVNAELAAVCDVNEPAASDAMRRYRLPTYYLSCREMLEREQLQAVAIATRTPERRTIIEECVKNKIRAIYCEKPLCNTLEESDMVARLIGEHGIHFVYGTRRRYMPAYVNVRERVMAGDIGELTTIVVRFGYGRLLWAHPHSVDIASFLAGDAEVEYVQADLDLDPLCISGAVVDADPMVRMGYIKFLNGVTAHIVASDSWDVELSGTQGAMCVRSDGVATHWRSRLPGDSDEGWLLSERVISVDGRGTGTVNSIEAVADAVLEGKPPGYDIRLALRNQEVLFGFVYSHLAGGIKVRFPVERRNMSITGRWGKLFA